MLSRMPSSERSQIHLESTALCINQEDLDDALHKIAIMDKLYRAAENVLVCLVKKNEFTDARKCHCSDNP